MQEINRFLDLAESIKQKLSLEEIEEVEKIEEEFVDFLKNLKSNC